MGFSCLLACWCVILLVFVVCILLGVVIVADEVATSVLLDELADVGRSIKRSESALDVWRGERARLLDELRGRYVPWNELLPLARMTRQGGLTAVRRLRRG